MIVKRTPFKAHIEPVSAERAHELAGTSPAFTDPTKLADAPCLCPVCGRLHSSDVIFLTRIDAEAAFETCQDGTTLSIPCVGECDLASQQHGLAPGYYAK